MRDELYRIAKNLSENINELKSDLKDLGEMLEGSPAQFKIHPRLCAGGYVYISGKHAHVAIILEKEAKEKELAKLEKEFEKL